MIHAADACCDVDSPPACAPRGRVRKGSKVWPGLERSDCVPLAAKHFCCAPADLPSLQAKPSAQDARGSAHTKLLRLDAAPRARIAVFPCCAVVSIDDNNMSARNSAAQVDAVPNYKVIMVDDDGEVRCFRWGGESFRVSREVCTKLCISAARLKHAAGAARDDAARVHARWPLMHTREDYSPLAARHRSAQENDKVSPLEGDDMKLFSPSLAAKLTLAAPDAPPPERKAKIIGVRTPLACQLLPAPARSSSSRECTQQDRCCALVKITGAGVLTQTCVCTPPWSLHAAGEEARAQGPRRGRALHLLQPRLTAAGQRQRRQDGQAVGRGERQPALHLQRASGPRAGPALHRQRHHPLLGLKGEQRPAGGV